MLTEHALSFLSPCFFIANLRSIDVQPFLSRGCLKRCVSNLKLIMAHKIRLHENLSPIRRSIYSFCFFNVLLKAVSSPLYFLYFPLIIISEIYGGRSGTGASAPSPRHCVPTYSHISVILPLLHTHTSPITNAV